MPALRSVHYVHGYSAGSGGPPRHAARRHAARQMGHSLEPLHPGRPKARQAATASPPGLSTAYEAAASRRGPPAPGCARTSSSSHPSLDLERSTSSTTCIDSQLGRQDLFNAGNEAPSSATAWTWIGCSRSCSSAGSPDRRCCLPYLLRACAELHFRRAALSSAPGRPTRRRSWARSRDSWRAWRMSARASWVDRRDAPRAEVITLLSHGTVFACPSVYELGTKQSRGEGL